jgi:cytochrome c551
MSKLFKFTAFIVCLSLIPFSCGETPYVQGEYLYNTKCANCHMSDGAGLGGMVPELYQLKTAASQQSVCTILNGRRDTLWSDKSFLVKEMPAFRNLTATELSNILNYINHKWSTDFRESTILEVQNYITNCNPVK